MPPGVGTTSVIREESKEVRQPEENYLEQWRAKKTWRFHKGGVYDLAWSPDNVHLASCGTDSQIIIWNINEACKSSN